MNKLFIGIFLLMFLIACKREGEITNADVRNYNPDKFEPSELDEWLKKEFLDPYNIEVLYRWKRELSNVAKDITPPYENLVQPAMEAVKATWLIPYQDVAGKEFIKKLSPKQIFLTGSAEYNENGTITLGTAEGGRKIVLNVINYFSQTHAPGFKGMIHTIHHEFTHIINQIVAIPTDFQTISRGGYFGNWNSESDATALSLGFVSRYARTNEIEDFAEMVSHLLVEGQYWFDNRVASAPTPEAGNKLRAKERMIVDYFYQNFNIDFRLLQRRMEKSFDDVSTLPFMINNGNVSSITSLTPKGKRVKPTKFEVIWDTAVARLQNASTAGYLIKDLSVIFNDSKKATFRYSFTPSSGSPTYLADYIFNMSVMPNGSTTFTPSGPPTGNAAVIQNGMRFLNDYWKNNEFVADWLFDYLPGSWGYHGGFYLKSDKSHYCYGNIVQ